MRIECKLDYWSRGVATFDPEKVMGRLQEAFPEVVIDPRDQAAEEVERVQVFLNAQELAQDQKAKLLNQIRGKARRNGPVYSFELPAAGSARLQGRASRYSVRFIEL